MRPASINLHLEDPTVQAVGYLSIAQRRNRRCAGLRSQTWRGACGRRTALPEAWAWPRVASVCSGGEQPVQFPVAGLAAYLG